MPIAHRPWQPRTGGTPGSAGFRWDVTRGGWIGPGGNFVPAGTNDWLSQFEPAFAGEKKLRRPVPPRAGRAPRRPAPKPKPPTPPTPPYKKRVLPGYEEPIPVRRPKRRPPTPRPTPKPKPTPRPRKGPGPSWGGIPRRRTR